MNAVALGVPWYAEDDWEPGSIRTLGRDYRLEADLLNWTKGKPLTPGLQHVYTVGATDTGFLRISYRDGRDYGSDHGTWSVTARQTVTERDVAVFGYASIVTALEDCVEMARDYEREDLIDLAMPGLS